ncbi:MAG: hypothetical protein ACTS2F_12750 [Thainema sp.]
MHHSINRNSEINLSPRRVAIFLGGLVVAIAVGHAAVHLMSLLFDIKSTPLVGLFWFFNMGSEANLPSYISALNLLFAGSLCALIAHRESSSKKYFDWHWWGLAAGLLLMSFDEAAQIHEGIVGQFLLGYFERGEGAMHYVWYRLYVPLVCIIGCLYLPFIKRLPLRYSLQFLLSALIFLVGALGFEILESYLAFNGHSLGLSILFEETFEMLGVVILIYTLLIYLAECRCSLRFNVLIENNKKL